MLAEDFPSDWMISASVAGLHLSSPSITPKQATAGGVGHIELPEKVRRCSEAPNRPRWPSRNSPESFPCVEANDSVTHQRLLKP